MDLWGDAAPRVGAMADVSIAVVSMAIEGKAAEG